MNTARRLARIAWLLMATSAPLAAQETTRADTGLRGAYDAGNPFARILRGELPASRVYEDAHTLAFIALGMRAPGHTLVIPKSPVRTLLEITPADLAHVMRVVQCVADAQRVALGATGVQLMQNNGAAAGQSVFHLHVHVIPYVPGVPVHPPGVADASRAEMEAAAARLAAAMTATACRPS